MNFLDEIFEESQKGFFFFWDGHSSFGGPPSRYSSEYGHYIQRPMNYQDNYGKAGEYDPRDDFRHEPPNYPPRNNYETNRGTGDYAGKLEDLTIWSITVRDFDIVFFSYGILTHFVHLSKKYILVQKSVDFSSRKMSQNVIGQFKTLLG